MRIGDEDTSTVLDEQQQLVAVRARRADVVRRLHERGVPLRALEALLPGWEDAIAAVGTPGSAAAASGHVIAL